MNSWLFFVYIKTHLPCCCGLQLLSPSSENAKSYHLRHLDKVQLQKYMHEINKRMMYGWVLQSKQSKAKVAQGTSFVSSVLCELFTLSFAKKIRNDNGLTTLYVDCWCYNVISFGDSHISLPQPLGIQSFGQELAGIGGWLYRLCTFDPTVSSPNISRTTTLLQMA